MPRKPTRKEKMVEAVKLYQEFTGMEADHYTALELPRVDVAMLVGEVEVIAYNTIRDGKKERYMHTFKKSARPKLAASHDGKVLMIIGDKFEFTERGITDE